MVLFRVVSGELLLQNKNVKELLMLQTVKLSEFGLLEFPDVVQHIQNLKKMHLK